MPNIAKNLPGLQSPLQADVLTKRPYFLVPFGEPVPIGGRGAPDLVADDREEVNVAIEHLIATQIKPITDVFILCHGWHRNLCAAVAAYDRLLSRFLLLVSRGRIDVLRDSGPKFNPLFLGIHWNSDPEQDAWIDRAGRRDKASFLEQARRVFAPEPSQEAGFLTDMEDAFAAMSQVSAPDSSVAIGSDLDALEHLTVAISKYSIRGQVHKMGPAEKVTALWRCYFEADTMALLQSQGMKPKRAGNPLTAISTFVKFILGFVGLTAIASGVLKDLWAWLEFPSKAIVSDLKNWSNPAHAPQLPLYNAEKCLAVLGVLTGCFLILLGAAWLRNSKKNSASTGLPFQAIAWFPVQLVVTLPALVFLLFTYLLRSPFSLVSLVLALLGWYSLSIYVLVVCAVAAFILVALNRPLSGVFREKLKAPYDRALAVRDYLVMPARALIGLVKRSVGEDSAVTGIADSIDNQLAFFEMQRRGVQAGSDLGDWLFGFLQPRLQSLAASMEPSAGPVKLHFIAHSFGALVASNAARTLDQMCLAGAPYKSTLRNLFYLHSAHDVAVATPPSEDVTTVQAAVVGGDIKSAVTQSLRPQALLTSRYVACQPRTRDQVRVVDATRFRLTAPPGDRQEWGSDPAKNLTASSAAFRIESQSSQSVACRGCTIKSLVLLQGAIATDWFELEVSLMKRVGTLAIFYSAYDTANGFYYPCANNGRMAAGYVGLTAAGGGKMTQVGAGAEFALLVKPPALRGVPDPPRLNVDASRLCFNGPAASGGGHDDIFKDDLVNLIWSVIRL